MVWQCAPMCVRRYVCAMPCEQTRSRETHLLGRPACKVYLKGSHTTVGHHTSAGMTFMLQMGDTAQSGTYGSVVHVLHAHRSVARARAPAACRPPAS